MAKQIKLPKNDRVSIQEFKKYILKEYPDSKLILFGSKVKGKDDQFSDIDILVLLNRKINCKIEDHIFDLGYDIGLKYNVVLNILVESNQFWNSPLGKVMPIHKNIDKDGIHV